MRHLKSPHLFFSTNSEPTNLSNLSAEVLATYCKTLEKDLQRSWDKQEVSHEALEKAKQASSRWENYCYCYQREVQLLQEELEAIKDRLSIYESPANLTSPSA